MPPVTTALKTLTVTEKMVERVGWRPSRDKIHFLVCSRRGGRISRQTSSFLLSFLVLMLLPQFLWRVRCLSIPAFVVPHEFSSPDAILRPPSSSEIYRLFFCWKETSKSGYLIVVDAFHFTIWYRPGVVPAIPHHLGPVDTIWLPTITRCSSCESLTCCVTV